MRYFFKVIAFFIPFISTSQTGVLNGIVTDLKTNQPVIGANIILIGTDIGTSSDIDGKYKLEKLSPGIYNIQVSYLGYETITQSEVEVQGIKPTNINFSMVESSKQLDEIVVKASMFKTSSESPVSLRTIGVSEIKRNPGGNRDISRVIQSLPGVTSTASFRNDLIIRGGAPNENRFFIDDVEIPVINHFATQGSSGGPAGIINVDFIREVDFFSGAFPSSRGNALSSVFNFKFRDGRDDRIGTSLTAGASDIGWTLEGPIGNKSTFLFSARKSYLQFLFKALGLPFLPTYTDFNLKCKYKIDNKNEITFIGLGAVDDFEINTSANETESKQYLIDRLPVNTQWNYTNGLVFRHYTKSGYANFVLSRSMLNNDAVKYLNNDDSNITNLILNYKSQEIENKLRFEYYSKFGNWDYLVGSSYEYVKYNNSTFNAIYTSEGPERINFSSSLDLHKFGAFTTFSQKFLSNKLDVSISARLDGNSYSQDMSNPLQQFSPRFSASYKINNIVSTNFNLGRYFQLPPFTTLGYRYDNVLINKQNKIKYISCNQYIFGFEVNPDQYNKITIEGYYKAYSHYPYLIREKISLANLGGDFGVIGNEPILSISNGTTYGIELMAQRRISKGFYGILAYTLGKSQFSNENGNFAPSSWDSRHIISFTGGKRFESNWEIGIKYRFQSGLPYSPYSIDSDLAINWDRNLGGIPDYNQINSLRYNALGTLDIRIDKKFFFKNWDLNLYLDIQNLTMGSISKEILILDRPLDNNKPLGGPIIINPDDNPELFRYKVKKVIDKTGTLLPTIGIVISF